MWYHTLMFHKVPHVIAPYKAQKYDATLCGTIHYCFMRKEENRQVGGVGPWCWFWVGIRDVHTDFRMGGGGKGPMVGGMARDSGQMWEVVH